MSKTSLMLECMTEIRGGELFSQDFRKNGKKIENNLMQ